jgi:hemerythrin-like metal-binding protein/PAS domain S-box-containing protein
MPTSDPQTSSLYESLFEHSADGVLLSRLDGSVLRANPAACRALRMTEAEVMRAGRDGVVVDDGALQSMLAERQEKGAAAGEVRFRRGDGTIFPVELTSARIPGPGGLLYACTIFRDITDRRRTEDALRESEERFRVAFQASPDSLSLNRLGDGVYLAVNDGFTRFTGWEGAEVMGRTPMDLQLWATPTDQRRLTDGLQVEDCVQNLEAKFRRKGGELVPGLVSARVFTLRGESLVLSMTRDITDLRRAEAERDRLRSSLHQASKLEAIGQLAGGVAHDFNNLLTVIIGCAELLREEAGRGQAPSAEVVEDIAFAAGRARKLTRQLLTFARKQDVSLVSLDVNETVRATGKLLRRLVGTAVELKLTLQPDLWPARFDPGQLEQVIVNLSVNARDAMPAGGTLTIETSNVEAAGDAAPPGGWIRLSVRDTGVGLTPEAREHLFEPFFTTKPRGKGTGLGLATVHGIVFQCGGEISVESEPGQGTAFHVLLPRSAASAEPTSPRAEPVTGSEHVLVVEDEPQVREVTQGILRRAGYQVLAASSGDEALSLEASVLAPVRLVVTDVVMPGLDGRATAEELRRRHPSMRVLYVSGYTRDVIGQRGVLDPGVQFLAKPFTAAMLLARVRAILDAPGHGDLATLALTGTAGEALWTPDLATGSEEIDLQHRELLDWIAALEGAARGGQLAQAEEALRFLERYAAEHFATEERHMASTGYPGMASHQALHAAFTVELGRRKAEFLANRSQASLLLGLAEWLADWLREHVRGADAEMARHLRSRER